MITALAGRHSAWGHCKIWAMARHSGHWVSMSTTARILQDAGLLLKADYQRERRQLAQARKAAFATTPSGPNMVWQFHFSEYETARGGTWRGLSPVGWWVLRLSSVPYLPLLMAARAPVSMGLFRSAMDSSER